MMEKKMTGFFFLFC